MDTVRRYAMLIDGDWVDTDGRFEIRSPATEELMASVAKGGREHADLAVAAAKAARAGGRWRRTPPQERAAVLGAIADRLTERAGDLAVLEALENGAPVRQAGAFQIGFSIAHLRYFAGQARTYAFERSGPLLRVPTLAAGLVRREPVGVCAAIVPWNFPLLLAMWKIGPALAAGNAIVVKPDEHTPLTLLEFARIATECGLPMNQGQACESGTRIIVAGAVHDKFVERLPERALGPALRSLKYRLLRLRAHHDDRGGAGG